MTHRYQITGMVCSGCEANIKSALLTIDAVTRVEFSEDGKSVGITMKKHVSLPDLQNVLDHKYQILPVNEDEMSTQNKSWYETYKPVLLIFAYLIFVSLIVQVTQSKLDYEQFMRHFMAGFFLVFSFFKLLNLKGFAESYSRYDLIARVVPVWAYSYPFLELAFGIAYLINFNTDLTNLVTLAVMSVSLAGVLQTVLNKKKIQCACLGVVFNLPMSTVTIIEDGLMIVMSAAMLLNLN